MKNRLIALVVLVLAFAGFTVANVFATVADETAITPVITGMVTDLIPQIILIVTALAVIVLIGVLVNYGFKKLRSVGSK